MIKFKDIPRIPRSNYIITVEWKSLIAHINQTDIELIMEPDYQRGHVWTDEQYTAYVEYGLMGGESSRDITCNCPGWMDDFRGPYELVDGLQRVTAVKKFLNNEIKAFGYFYNQFTDKLHYPYFNWSVLCLPNRTEVLKFYIIKNSGGTVHANEEIERVKKLLELENR